VLQLVNMLRDDAGLKRAFSPLESVVWRDGRVAEGGGLLNRCTVKSRTGGSNPPLSAIFIYTQ
jgi:hypothetical protein